jgi:hypothetical protein
MSSYDHFCFLQHIHSSAFPYVNSSAVFPSAEGSLRDALAETSYFYAQNLPTIVTLLPRVGLALALLLSFFSPENLPGGLSLSDVDQSIARRDGTFFDKNTGALSAYAKGILAAWRTLVLLLSWCVAFLCLLVISIFLNNINLGSVSGYSAGMAVRGSVGLAHAGRRKKSVAQLRSEAKSWNRAWPQLWVPVASMQFPGAGRNALSYACMRRSSFVSRFAHRAMRSQPSVPPKVDSNVSRRSLLLGLAVLRNHSQLAGACSRKTCLRTQVALSRAGVVRQMDRKA